jgi:aminocarboxymuconate-semialdehyde decarboxylase
VIVDVHTHFYPDAYREELERNPEPYALGRDALGRTILTLHGTRIVTMTREMTSPEDRIREMDRCGIDRQIISITIPNVYIGPQTRRRDLARRANDALADLVQRHPRRFAGLASLPLPDTGAAITEMERAVGELGMVGVIVGSNVEGRYLDDPAFFALYERAQELEVPLLIHPMPPASPDATFAPGLVPLLGFVFDTSASVARLILSGVLERLPRLVLILGHLGGTLPYLMQRLDNGYHAYPEIRGALPHPPSHYLRRLFYDTVSFSIPSLQCALGSVGAGQIVLGTDYPHVIGDIRGALSSVRDLGLPERATAAIMGRTAARIFPRLATAGMKRTSHPGASPGGQPSPRT